MNIDEIRKIGMAVARAYGSSENLVSVGFVPEKYIFSGASHKLWLESALLPPFAPRIQLL